MRRANYDAQNIDELVLSEPDTWLFCLHCDKRFRAKKLRVDFGGWVEKCAFCPAAGLGVDIFVWKGPTPMNGTNNRDLDDRPEVQQLLDNLKKALPQLEELLEECNSHWGYEDPVYRFYHHSFKVYGLQASTTRVVNALAALSPGNGSLHGFFRHIVEQGTGKTFSSEHNARWLEVTRPILEAFFHARYFLEMAVRYGRELDQPPQRLPSGWAALLYLYNLR